MNHLLSILSRGCAKRNKGSKETVIDRIEEKNLEIPENGKGSLTELTETQRVKVDLNA